MTAHDGSVTAVAQTPDGLHWVTAGNDSRVRLWEARRCRCAPSGCLGGPGGSAETGYWLFVLGHARPATVVQSSAGRLLLPCLECLLTCGIVMGSLMTLRYFQLSRAVPVGAVSQRQDVR